MFENAINHRLLDKIEKRYPVIHFDNIDNAICGVKFRNYKSISRSKVHH